MGTITWNFNQDNLDLKVNNTYATTAIYDGLPSGTYDYELLTPTDEIASVTINTFSSIILTLMSSQLILDEDVAADGFLLTFS